MNRFIIIILVTIVTQSLSGQFRAVYIPDDKLNQMKMDGDTSDWSWVPKDYIISSNYMVDASGISKPNLESFKSKVIVGWSDLTNWIYILAIIEDDFTSIDRAPPDGEFWLDDCMEVAINPDNHGGRYNNRNMYRFFNVVKFHYSFPMIDSSYEFELNKGPLWYLDKGKYIDWGGQEIKSHSRDESVIRIYEIGTGLWDQWSDQGPLFSKESQLTFNKIIRLAIAFDDVDEIKDQREAQWVTFSGKRWHYNADQMSQFILDAPLENEVSWQNIQYILNIE
jgi:hypothetical protein